MLRDPVLLIPLLTRTPRPETFTRNALITGLGMLGHVPALEVACSDLDEPDSISAYFGAVALGEDAEDECIRLGTEADIRARGAPCEVSQMAAMRLESGARLPVLD